MTRRIIPTAGGIPALEPVNQELYDTKPYPLIGTGTLDFFRNSAVGELNSNMVASGQLPHPQQFHVFGIACEIFPGYDEADTHGVSAIWAQDKARMKEEAFLRLRIGAKDYLTTPLNRVPEGVGLAGVAAGTSLTGGPIVVSNGLQDISHYYDVTVPQGGKIKPIHIPAQQSFFVQVRWPNLVAIDAYGVDEPPLIRVYLVGVLWREVQ